MASINLGRVQGYSAYEIAVQNGYSGTELEWLASLKGADGEDGTNGTDGVSPVASVERNQADTGAVITITDATGTTTATVNDGTTPSLTGYATETYVDNAVGAIDVPTATSDLTNDSGFITSSDLSGYAQTSSLATVATSGSYNDLSNKPTIPDVSGLATETYVDNAVAGITVPTAISDLTNDSGFVTANDLATVATSGDYDDLTNKPTIPAAPGIATAQTAGLVKPDGTTITIDANGTISSASSGGLSPDSRNNFVLPNSNNNAREDNSVQRNIIMGYGNGTGYQNSVNNAIFGQSNISYGSYNVIGGMQNTAAYNDNNNTYSSYSGIFGYYNSAKGDNSILAGLRLIGEADNQAIFGKYNSDRTSPLVVGIGTGNMARADGFKVTSAGNGVFAGTVKATDFLDSNGNSIIGGGGSAPVDPEASSNNVYTGDGHWNNAFTVWEDASINSLTITPSTPVTQSSNIFTLTTTTDFAGWGTQPLHMRLVGETTGSEHAEWEGDMLIWGSSGSFCTYRDAEKYWELNRTESSGTYTYTLKRIMYEQSSSIDTLSSFFISGDKFRTKLNDYGVQTINKQVYGSDYIIVNENGDGQNYQDFTVEAVTYPSTREATVTDTTIISINATGTVIGDNTTWQVQNVDFTDRQWTDWIASSGRKMTLYDNGGNEIWFTIDIDDSKTTSPYSGNNGETITVDRYLEISVPDTSLDGTVLDSVELKHMADEDYGLITYNNLPDARLNHITLKDRTTGDIYAIYVDNGQIGIEAVNSGM